VASEPILCGMSPTESAQRAVSRMNPLGTIRHVTNLVGFPGGIALDFTVDGGAVGSPVAGTFTVHWGRGKSDPVPYNAPVEDHARAWEQARERNMRIVLIEPVKAMEDDD